MSWVLHDKKTRGLTLIELLVAMLLSALLLAGVFRILDSNKAAYKVTDALSNVQENGRFAVNMMMKDILAADFWGCRTDDTEDMSEHGQLGSLTSLVAVSVQNNTGNNGSDILTIKSAGPEVARVASASGVELTVNDASEFEVGDTVLVSSCDLSYIVDIDSISGNIITISSSQVNSERLNNMATMLYPVQEKVYSINSSSELTMNGEVLAEGIENMQIQYGVDGADSDFVPDAYLDTPSNPGDVVSMRVSLLAQSLDDYVTKEEQSYEFNGQTITPDDYRIRRVFSSTALLRNRVQ